MIKRVIWGVGVLAIACGGGDPAGPSAQTAPSAADSDSSAVDGAVSNDVDTATTDDATQDTRAGASEEIVNGAAAGDGAADTVGADPDHSSGGGSSAPPDGSGDTSAPAGAEGSGASTPAEDDGSSDSTDDAADPATPAPITEVIEQLLGVETLVEGQFGTFAVGAGSIYVADRGATVLARLPAAGGALEAITPALDALPDHLAADGAHLYSALVQRPGHTELWQLPVAGADVDAPLGALVGEVRSVAEMGVNTGGVVSLEDRPTPSTVTRRISRADDAAGVATVGTVNLLFNSAFAFDESAAYVVRGAEGVSDVVRVDLASGEASSLVSSVSGETLVALAASDGVVYFASDTRVGRLSSAGADAVAITLHDTPAYRLVADSGHVYFFAASSSGCAGGSELYRVAVTGGAAEHIAHEPAPGCIANFASDADGVYWLTADGSQLRALHWQ